MGNQLTGDTKEFWPKCYTDCSASVNFSRNNDGIPFKYVTVPCGESSTWNCWSYRFRLVGRTERLFVHAQVIDTKTYKPDASSIGDSKKYIISKTDFLASWILSNEKVTGCMRTPTRDLHDSDRPTIASCQMNHFKASQPFTKKHYHISTVQTSTLSAGIY